MKVIRQRIGWLPLSAVVWAWASIGAGFAATFDVSIGNNFFNPSSLTINVNDTVMWTWNGNNHTTTSTTGLWNSGIRNIGATFSRQFTSAGSFPYRCTVHLGQNGTINVQGSNTPPTVTITSPTNGTILAAPFGGTIQANAADSDGAIARVEFYADGVVLGSVTNTPYLLMATDVGAGTHSLTAVATDNRGATNTSSAITVSVVAPVPIVLSDMQRLSSTQFAFSHTANEGLRYRIHRSTTLSNWTGISTNTATTNLVRVLDNAASNGLNFYRVERLPNP